MAYIRTIDESQAQGLLARIYQAAVERAGRVFNILKIQSNNPPALKSSMDLYGALMKAESPLTRAQREMLAVVVSRANQCHY
ncbi:MAG: carboxymuconolactone decarboxylase family protein [Planctomycetota bacterium]